MSIRGTWLAAAAGAAIALAPQWVAAQGLGTLCPLAGSLNSILTGGAFSASDVLSITGSTDGTETFTATWTSAELGVFQVSVNGGPFTNLFTISPGGGSRTFTLPAGNNVVLRRTYGVPAATTGSIVVSCATTTPPIVPTTPTPPPTPTPAATTESTVKGALDDQAIVHIERPMDFFTEAFLDIAEAGALPYERALDVLETRQRERPGSKWVLVQMGTEQGYRVMSADSPLLTGIAPPMRYVSNQSQIDPSVAAISRFFDFGSNTLSGSMPLQSSIPGWNFTIAVDGAVIDRSFAALQRQTWTGNVAIAGRHRLDDETVLGTGLIFGGASTTFNTPVATVNSTYLGADVGVLHMLSPELAAGLFGDYRLGLHRARIGGVDSTFVSHTFGLAGTLRGEMVLGDYVLTPSLDAMVSNRFVPGFTDGAGVAIPGFSTIDFDMSAGATISRGFYDPERDLMITPFAGVNLIVDVSSETGAIVAQAMPADPIRVEAVGGVRLSWLEGASMTVEGKVSRGTNTTTLGVSATLSVPIN